MSAGINNTGAFWIGTAFGLAIAAVICYSLANPPLELQEAENFPIPPDPLLDGKSEDEHPQMAQGETPFLEKVSTFLIGISAISRQGDVNSPFAYGISRDYREISKGEGETIEYLPKTSSKLPQTSRLTEITSLIPLENSPQTPADLAHSEDFHTIWKGGKRWELTLNQSRVMEKFYRGFTDGISELNQQAVLVDLGINSQSIREVFKRNREAFKALFELGERKGSLRLKIG